jgi:WD40 repeat protein
MNTRQLLHKLIGDFRVVSVAFSPDGRRLASAGSDRIVRLWDMTTGQEVLSLRGHEDIIGRLLFSPDGQRLASASQDGMVRVWDASPFDENSDPRIRTLGGPDDGEFNGVAFDPEGRWLASASSDKSIKRWDAQTGREIRAFHGHQEAVVCVAFSPPDGKHLLSGSMDRTVKLWDVESGRELPLPDRDRFNLMVCSVAFSPDGQSFAAAGHQEVRLCDLTGRSPPLSLQADSEFVSCVAFSKDGKRLATVGHTGIVKIWDVASGEIVCTFRGPPTNAVALHPKRGYVAFGGSDGQVRLWDPTTGHETLLPKQTDQIESVAFSPDGKYLATASLREVIVWDVSNLDKIKKKRTFDRIAGRIWSVAFSPDGKRLAAATGYKGKGKIKIWESSLWEQVGVLSP